MIRLRQSLATDAGSAVVGFALGAPLMAIVATYCLSFIGVVWSRETAAELMHQELRKLAVGEVTQPTAAQELRDEFTQRGWRDVAVTFPNKVINGVKIVAVAVEFSPTTIVQLPAVSLSEWAYDETQ